MRFKVTISRGEDLVWFITDEISDTDADTLRRTVRREYGVVEDATITVEELGTEYVQ